MLSVCFDIWQVNSVANEFPEQIMTCFTIDTTYEKERKLVMSYDGSLTLPKNYSVMCEEDKMYLEGGVSAELQWYGVDIKFSSHDLQGIAAALATGSGAAWLAAELGAPTVVGGITFGTIAAGLATAAGAAMLADWASNGNGITYHARWNGTGWISF